MSRFPCVDNAVEVESSISTGRQVVRDEMMQSQTRVDEALLIIQHAIVNLVSLK